MIRRGEIIPNTEAPISEGVTRPVACIARIDGESVRVVAKRIRRQEIEAECVCAILLRAWGISVPEPVLLSGADGAVLFGSVHTEYPDLKHGLGIVPGLPAEIEEKLIAIAAAIICTWDDAAQALAADELIENGDRNIGNFLWDGEEHAYIDHERALGLQPFTGNVIAKLANIAGETTKMRMMSATFAYAKQAESLPGMGPQDDMDFGWGLDFITERVRNLGERVLARFPTPRDLFNQDAYP
jgi:hypothetical protein